MGNTKGTQTDIEKLILELLSNFSRAKYTVVVLVLGESIRNKSDLSVHAVKVIKAVIKSETLPNIQKYRALHLLKEMLKITEKSFREQCEGIIMNRLKQLALSSYGDKILLGYNNKSDLPYSKRFYRLLLECLAQWHTNFGQSHRFFINCIGEMKMMKIYPSTVKYYSRFQVGSAANLSQYLSQLRQSRINFASAFTDYTRTSLRNIETDCYFFLYEKQLLKIGQFRKIEGLLECAVEKKEALEAELAFLEKIRTPYFAVEQSLNSAQRFIECFRESYCSCFWREEYFPDFEILFSRVLGNKMSRITVGYQPLELQVMIQDPLDAESLESSNENPETTPTVSTNSIPLDLTPPVFRHQKSSGDIQLTDFGSNVRSITPSNKFVPYVPTSFTNSIRENSVNRESSRCVDPSLPENSPTYPIKTFPSESRPGTSLSRIVTVQDSEREVKSTAIARSKPPSLNEIEDPPTNKSSKSKPPSTHFIRKSFEFFGFKNKSQQDINSSS